MVSKRPSLRTRSGWRPGVSRMCSRRSSGLEALAGLDEQGEAGAVNEVHLAQIHDDGALVGHR